MMKKITKLGLFSALVLGFASIGSHAALAATCTLNGRDVDCTLLGNQLKGFLGLGVAGFFASFIAIGVLGICSMVFWIMMIVHAAKHDIEDRAMWIIIMVFTGIIGALVYYFVVKKKFIGQVAPSAPPPTVQS